MIDVESLWLQLIEEGESDRLEAKEAQGGIGDSIMQSITSPAWVVVICCWASGKAIKMKQALCLLA